jgi:multisubunit Na+/H+ antiporter MnhC subunit
MADLKSRRQAKGLIVRAGGKIAKSSRERVAAMMQSRHWLRVHSSILLLWTFSAGLLTTKAMYALGVQSMGWRYTVAILVGYGAFLLGVRLWLAYVGVPAGGGGHDQRKAQSNDSSSVDITDFIPSGRGGGGSTPVFRGGGGGSGGGGASASFDGAPSVPMPSNLVAADLTAASGGDGNVLSDAVSSAGNTVSETASGVGDAISGIADVGDGEGCLIAFAIMIVVALIGLAIGGAFFVISMGPEILIDAAFSAMLSGGLLKSGQKVSDPDWLGSVFKATWKPLVIVLVLTWVFVGVAASLTPGAHTFGEVWRQLESVL